MVKLINNINFDDNQSKNTIKYKTLPNSFKIILPLTKQIRKYIYENQDDNK